MHQFNSGLLAAFCFVLSLFFMRSWRQSTDQLFMNFGLAFWLFSLENTLIASMREAGEAHWPVYLIRLTGFSLIIYSILRKNLSTGPEPDRAPRT